MNLSLSQLLALLCIMIVYSIYIRFVRTSLHVCENKNRFYRRKFLRAADEKLMAN